MADVIGGSRVCAWGRVCGWAPGSQGPTSELTLDMKEEAAIRAAESGALEADCKGTGGAQMKVEVCA